MKRKQFKYEEAKSELSEYEALRNEIVSVQELQRSVWLHMYIIYIPLIVLGFEWSYYFFLISFAVIIPFKCVIDDYSNLLDKISCYIIVFFEKDYEIHWESLHRYKEYKQFKKVKKIKTLLRSTSVAHLGLLSSIFFIYFYINMQLTIKTNLSIINLLWVAFALSLSVWTIILSLNLDQPNIDDSMNIMVNFKNSVKTKKSKNK